MGCECLGPKKSQEEVFLKLIKSIHEESQKITIDLSQSDVYPALMERIAKKGQLRKLTDNLSSRRHKIQDALAFNYKLTTQSKEIGHWYIGLIIVDSISEVIYPKKFSLNFDNISKSDETSQDTLNRNSLSKSSQRISKKKTDSHNLHATQYSAIDEQYFKIVKFLYPLDPKLKKRVLETIDKFCWRHVGVIGCEAELWSLIDKIVEDLRSGTEQQFCSRTFKNLMLRTRDQIVEQMRNREILQTLLMLWLKQQDRSERSEMSKDCFQILSIYFDRFISAWESEFLFESMFSVFDRVQFDRKVQPLLQKLCQDLVEGSELKKNFFRSLFNYLLGYLSISQDHTNRKKWLMTSLGIKTENIKSLFKNVLVPSIKIKTQGLKRANVWIDKNYIDINEFCLYNNKPLVYVYTSILAPFLSQIPIKEQILQQYRKTAQKLTPSRQQILLETTIEQFQEEQISIKQQQAMLVLIKQLVKMIEWDKRNRNLFESVGFFIPVYVDYPQAKKLEIINLNSFLLTVIDISGCSESTVFQIAELMYTFYGSIVNDNCNFPQRFQILNKHVQYLRDLSRKCRKQILIAYYEIICEKSNQNVRIFSIEVQFCLLFLGFTLRKLITGEQLPSRVGKIKKSIDNRNNKIESLPELNQYFFDKDKLMPLENSDFQEKRIFNRAFSSKTLEKMDSIDRRQGFLRRSNSEIKTDHDDDNDRSFAEAIDIIAMK